MPWRERLELTRIYLRPQNLYLLLALLLLFQQVFRTIADMNAVSVLFVLLLSVSLLARWRSGIRPDWILLDFVILTSMSMLAEQPTLIFYLVAIILHLAYQRRLHYAMLAAGLVLWILGTSVIPWLLAALIAGTVLMLWEIDHMRNISHVDELRLQGYSLEQTQQRLLFDFKNAEEMTRLEERQKLAERLHDNLGHDLTAVDLLQKAAVSKLNSGGIEETKTMLFQAETRLQNALALLHEAVYKIEPEDSSGLSQMKKLVNDFVLPIKFSHTGNLMQIRPYLWQMILSTAREALTNVTKHAKAREVSIDLSVTDTITRLVIINDGVTQKDQRVAGSGLRYIRNRLEAVNGSLSLRHERGNFQLVMTVPLHDRIVERSFNTLR